VYQLLAALHKGDHCLLFEKNFDAILYSLDCQEELCCNVVVVEVWSFDSNNEVIGPLL